MTGSAARRSLSGRLVIAVTALAAIVLSLYYFDDSPKPNPVVSSIAPQPVVTAQQSPAPAERNDNVTLTIDTELGRLRAEFYPEKAPAAVAELIALARSGYFNSDTVLEVRPGLGFVIAKLGNGAKKYKVVDEKTGLSSRRGSIAISKSSVSGAYLNNLFFGFNPQPELEKQYIIIGQVLEGLERFERSAPETAHKINGFSVTDDIGPQATKSQSL